MFTVEVKQQQQMSLALFCDKVDRQDTRIPRNSCFHLGLTFSLQNILQLQPYHIDALMQLSEVFRMSEDMQMAAELIGRLVLNESFRLL